jgi:hypothetical protein
MAAKVDVRERGSAQLLDAWKAGVVHLDDTIVTGLSEVLNGIQGRVEGARVLGAEHAEAVSVDIAYDGEDVPRCGNDVALILRHLGQVGGAVPVHVIINGVPALDALRVTLEVGNV